MKLLLLKWLILGMVLSPLFLLRGVTNHYQEAPNVATTEGLPSNLVDESVCVISGDYSDSVVDVIVPGPEPLVLQRNYSNYCRGNLGKSWSFNHYDQLVVGEAVYEEKQPIWIIGLRQPSGSQLDYIYPKSKEALKKKDLLFRLSVPKGLTNGASTLSGRSNLRNQTLHFYPDEEKVVAISGAGNRRTFKKIRRSDEGWNICGEESEEKVNGSLYKYVRHEKNWMGISQIICQSKKTDQVYSALTFAVASKKDDASVLKMETHDGRVFRYYFKRHQLKITEKDKANQTTHSFSQYYLSKVKHPNKPVEDYEYGQKEMGKDLQMTYKRRPEGRFVKIDYYHQGMNHIGEPIGIIQIDKEKDWRLDRVKRLQAPVGVDETPITTHRFVYHCKIKKHKKNGRQELLKGETKVFDAYDHLTHYFYDDSHRLTSWVRHQGTSSYLPYSQENYVWSEEGNLIGKIFKNGKNEIHHARYFTYDARGNVLTSSLCGRLTGLPCREMILDDSQHLIENGYESDKKSYTYSQDDLNLVLSETDCHGKTIVYDYLKNTDHVRAKYVIYEGKIQLREFYAYDDHYVVIKKVTDNGSGLSSKDLSGVTERHYTMTIPRKEPPFGLPEHIEELYLDLASREKKLLRKANFYYTPQGYLVKQEVFDSNHQLAYTLHWEYDEHGNVILETNPLGETTVKKYDANDNLIFQQDFGKDFYLQNTYDFANRLIQQEEIHTDGQRFSTTHTYDYLNNCVSTVNPYGQTTSQTFDEFGRVLATQYPAILNEAGELVHPIVSKTYDIAGYPISTTDAKGGKIEIEYNVRGQPIKTSYPDGSCEEWRYRLDGQLVHHIMKNGTNTIYAKDHLGRATEETTYTSDGQLLKKIQHIYNSLHLLHTIDAMGSLTTYTYDGAGRLEWIDQNGKKQKNIYDPMGRLAEIREWFGNSPDEYRATIKVYDLLDRIIEERLQSPDGTVLHLARYAYDADGNRTWVKTGEQETRTEYNSHHQPIKITNALGGQTHTTYNHFFINAHGQRVLQTITTDPLGYQTIDTYDTAQRLVETLRRNPFGQKIAYQTTHYDLCGNPCHIQEEIIQGTVKEVRHTLYTYSENNQVTSLTEGAETPQQKITRTLYNAHGKKSITIKPDGVLLFFNYDPLERLSTLYSSDQTIHHCFEYNLRDQVTQAKDLSSGQITQREYDQSGNMIKENLGNHLNIEYAYDYLRRPRFILFPDQTAAEYLYNAVDLKEIHRLIKGERVYSHQDKQHNLSGYILKSTLPGNNGEVDYAYNPLGHCIAIHAKQYHQETPSEGFDLAGRLKEFQAQGIPYRFTYDDYSHINSEEGHTSHTYCLDSASNRIEKDGEPHTYNTLNQLIQKGKEQFTYDQNGNLIQRIGEKTTLYTYDALDRLTSVTQEGKKTQYIYDPFHRRLSKQQEEKEEQFLYQGQEEIGKWSQGKCQELRLLGKNPRSLMVALELQGTPYVPLHDFSGNVVCLLNHQGETVERYRYTAFGEEEILNPQGEKQLQSTVGNPWRYANKRLDEESGLIAFGLRYYDSGTSRWMTCDPAGFADGSNLYAYVHHSPLLYYDQFGLYKNIGVFGLLGSTFLNNAYKNVSTCYCVGIFSYQAIAGESEIQIQYIAIEEQIETKYHFRDPLVPFERTNVYRLNDNNQFTNPETNAPFQLKQANHKGIGFINGINTSLKDFKENMKYLGQFSEYDIIGIHSASLGKCTDIKCYFNATFRYQAYEGVRELHKVWYEFFKNSPIDATFLMFCHSRGVAYVRNALLSFPEDLRNRIEIIAIAPGAYIESYLCKGIKHYESSRDIVPLLDIAGRQRCQSTIITLEPAPGADFWLDHSFMSPTYIKEIKFSIKAYNAK